MVEAGGIVAAQLGSGVKGLNAADYPDEIAAIRGELGNHPMLCAGMVGSAMGWREMPYVDVPASLDDLAALLEQVVEGVWLMPGVAQRGERPDVMRGEEVQFLGAARLHPLPDGALPCQPGTHSKWARVDGGRIMRFRSAMTGELFASLKAHSVLAPFLASEGACADAFTAGVRASGEDDLLAQLFQVRAGAVMGTDIATDHNAFVSGLLIGTDVRAAGLPSTHSVRIIDDGPLGERYQLALQLLGQSSTLLSSPIAFCAGATALWTRRR